MKICIDARMYGPHVGGGGLGRYVQEVILALQKIDQENDYVVLLKKDNFEACPTPNKRWAKVRADIHWYSFAEQLRLPRLIDSLDCDLVHFPHFNMPLRLKTPFTVTLHDLIMLNQPDSARATTRGSLFYRVKRLGYRIILNHIARNAQEIVTVSDYARSQILTHLKAPAKHVHVVYNGITRTPDSGAKTNTQSPAEKTLIKTLSQPFFLNVGNAYPHKNLITLLHTFSFFVREYPDAHLVLVGGNDVFRQRLKREASEIGIPADRIHFPGHVSEATLNWLYAQAKGYVIPSLEEGFGLPPLEALKAGTPVAAARASCLPEILGEAAVYFAPRDIEDLFQAMETLLNDRETVTRLLTASHDVIGRYTWSDHAKALISLFQHANKHTHGT